MLTTICAISSFLLFVEGVANVAMAGHKKNADVGCAAVFVGVLEVTMTVALIVTATLINLTPQVPPCQ